MVKVKVTLSYAGILNETLEETEAIIDGVESILKDGISDSSLEIGQNFNTEKKINFYEEDEIFGERHEVLLSANFHTHCNSLEELSETIFEECEDLLLDFSLDLEDVFLEEKEEEEVLFSSEILLAEETGGCNCCEEGKTLNVDTGEAFYDYQTIYSLSIPMGGNALYTVRMCEKCRNDLIHHLIEMGNLK